MWRDNHRRWQDQTPTQEVLRTYGPDYKVIIVGDAAMSPYEIVYPGGANEHHNAEAGEVWLRRLRDQWPASIWFNPLPRAHWDYTQSVGMIRELFEDEMYPLTLEGISAGARALG